MIPGTETNHYVLYALNKYRDSVDVLDSKKWPKNSKKLLTRKGFHGSDVKEIVSSYQLYPHFFCFLSTCFYFLIQSGLPKQYICTSF